VVVKSKKSNTNANFLSRYQGEMAIEDISAEFPDEFSDQKEILVFHLSEEGNSKFQDVIDYLMDQRYPEGLSREEKIIFQEKVDPYSLIKGALFIICVNCI